MRRLPVLIIFIFTACGDDSGSNGSAASHSTNGIDRYIEAYCKLARNCCSKAGRSLDPLSECESEFERQMARIPSVRAGKVLLRQPEFDECIAALDTVAGSCTVGPFPAETCSSIFIGTAQKGESCEEVIECQRDADPVVCIKNEDAADPLTTSGVCDKLDKVGVGEPCFEDADERFYGSTIESYPADTILTYCDRREGLYCKFPERVCTTLPSEGQACEYDCSEGLYCDESDNTCKTVLPEGTPCNSHDQCENGFGCFIGTCERPSIEDSGICEGDFS